MEIMMEKILNWFELKNKNSTVYSTEDTFFSDIHIFLFEHKTYYAGVKCGININK